jgi:putative ABC transport system permease protein
MFRNYLTIAYRNILRHKLFSFINILGLSLGISVCLLILLMIVDQFSYDAYNPNKDRIYRIITEQSWADNGKGKFAAAPAPLAQYLQVEYPGLDKVAFMRSLSYRALHNGKDMDLSGFYANPDFLDVFSRELEDGNPNNALNDPYSIVISEKVADMFFWNENPVGKVLSLEDYDGKKAGDFIVTGVLKERGNKSHLKYDLLVSMNTLTSLAKRNNDQTLSNWQQVSNYYVYALLKENQPVANLQHVLDELSRKELSRKEAYPHTRFELQHLLNINLTDEMLANEPGPILKAQILYLFGGLALIVIISACFNYNSLCVARSLNRAKEVGVRKVAGASRSHIIWQFLIESVLMALIALVFGLTFLQFIKPAFYNLDPFVKTLFNLDENLLVYALFVVFTIVVGITAGLFPALVLSRFQPVHVLKKLTNLSMFSKFRLQRILLVIQFSLSLICIIFTIVAYRQFAHTMEADLGFNTANVLNVSLQGQSYDLYKQSVAQHKNISTVSAASYLPGQGINMGVEVKKPGMEKSIWLDYVAVDPTIFRLWT